MNGRAAAVAGIAIAIVIMFLAFFLLGGIAQDPDGFQEGELTVPVIDVIDDTVIEPSPVSGSDYSVHLRTSMSYTNVYQEFGGTIDLFIENVGSNEVFVRSYGFNWEGEDDVFSVNCSEYISPGEEKGMGILYFEGPGTNGSTTFEVHMNLWASSPNGNFWSDKGILLVGSNEMECLLEPELHTREIDRNPVGYYNRFNDLVEFEAVSDLAEEVLGTVPGDYGVLQVIEAYELLRAEFPYLSDTDDHWQSASETISLGTGDCEDHAILLSSLLTVLGGDCRINLINGHAFPTVYIGNSTSQASEVKENVQAFYGNQVPVFWIEDELGFWLVVDTVGMPYVGGYPAASIPIGTDGGDSWNSESADWIVIIDVTGETVPGLVL